MHTNFAYSIIAYNTYTYTGCSVLFFSCLPRKRKSKDKLYKCQYAKRTKRAYVCARLNKKKAHAFEKVRHFIRLFLILFFFSPLFLCLFVWVAHRLLQLAENEQRLQFVNNSKRVKVWEKKEKKTRNIQESSIHKQLAETVLIQTLEQILWQDASK